jgi:succinoglycan biosynthesis protein ExoO
MEKVSILIPAHNASEFIADAVRSALSQSHQETEIIVLDDASQDDSVAVALRAGEGDARLKIVRSEVNIGPGPARNLGLARATGDWIALLDADDTWAPVRLESMLRIAKERDADFVADNILVVTHPGMENGFPALPVRFMSGNAPISAAEFIAADRPSEGTRSAGFIKPMMRAQFLRAHELEYDCRFRNGEDFHFYVRALLAGARLWLTPEAWYCYLFRASSQCRGEESDRPQQLLKANEDLLRHAQQAGYLAAECALRERGEEIANWIPYSRLVSALKGRQSSEAVRIFRDLPSRIYALKKLSGAVVRRATGAPEARLQRG